MLYSAQLFSQFKSLLKYWIVSGFENDYSYKLTENNKMKIIRIIYEYLWMEIKIFSKLNLT